MRSLILALVAFAATPATAQTLYWVVPAFTPSDSAACRRQLEQYVSTLSRDLADQYRLYEALRALQILGASRDHFMELAFDLSEPVLAGAAMSLLAEDPREDEGSEIQALAARAFDERILGVGGPASIYLNHLHTVHYFSTLTTLDAKINFLLSIRSNVFGPSRRWWERNLQEFHASHPEMIEAALENLGDDRGMLLEAARTREAYVELPQWLTACH